MWLSALVKECPLKKSFNVKEVSIDESKSIEHTKLKPLTIALAVCDDYKILGVKVDIKHRLEQGAHAVQMGTAFLACQESETTFLAMATIFSGARILKSATIPSQEIMMGNTGIKYVKISRENRNSFTLGLHTSATSGESKSMPMTCRTLLLFPSPIRI